MARNNELKKNWYQNYFHGIININDLDLNNILIDKKSYENISNHHASYKTLYGVKPLHIISY